MNKSILFVLHIIGIGGSMTSMLNLLELLKKQGYVIDLFIMEHEGIFLERAKNSANLLKEDIILSSVICDKNKLFKEKNLIKLLIRLIYVAVHKLFGSKKTNDLLYRWRAKKLDRVYKNVISFQEGITTEFVWNIKAKNKIAWVHTNYEFFTKGKTAAEMQKIYDVFDKIVCVSEASKVSMLLNLKNLENKTTVIYNSLNSDYILKKCLDYKFEVDKSIINFVSVGRFADAKRFDRIIDVSLRLAEKGFKFKWYIVGSGDLFYNIKDKIDAESIGEIVVLTGEKSNPYPIIKAADYLVITSSSETNPMVANEALILHKPVLSTSFSSVYEVIKDRKNGLICQNSTDGIFLALKEIFENKELTKTIKLGAENFTYRNEDIIFQISELMI